jgi:hypothetical protein
MRIVKSQKIKLALMVSAAILNSFYATAQNEDTTRFRTGLDIYSSYLWRGTCYGTGPALQPMLEYSHGVFSAGAWGSFDFHGYQESDLWISFSLPAGFSAGMTDYYYPAYDFLDYSTRTGSHALELNLSFSKWGLNLSWNYILNKAGNAGSKGGDKYFEAQYAFDSFYLFLGAGDGWHSTDADTGEDRFRICNTGIGVQRDLKITDSFSLPVAGQLIYNPDSGKMFLVAGISIQ